jgi:hypothetical protein
MKIERNIQSDFVRFRVKKNKKDWTTISLENELIDLMKLVFGLVSDDDVKDFVNRLANEIDFNFNTYSQVVKRKIYEEIGKKYKWLYNQIQPKLID